MKTLEGRQRCSRRRSNVASVVDDDDDDDDVICIVGLLHCVTAGREAGVATATRNQEMRASERAREREREKKERGERGCVRWEWRERDWSWFSSIKATALSLPSQQWRRWRKTLNRNGAVLKPCQWCTSLILILYWTLAFTMRKSFSMVVIKNSFVSVCTSGVVAFERVTFKSVATFWFFRKFIFFFRFEAGGRSTSAPRSLHRRSEKPWAAVEWPPRESGPHSRPHSRRPPKALPCLCYFFPLQNVWERKDLCLRIKLSNEWFPEKPEGLRNKIKQQWGRLDCFD